ncbi:hypothetical protein Pan258_14610 [Symmachiella dynata]|uniref:DUF1501 domain-containing protein n=1 Tax=Symmachiella dynata TaxID=2527995 RepID=UPI00118BC7A1|nr:DUF1501 domain-containing protein [Symmachiella dynata]QDT47426.1 hypothetical protein Pan258_14610 [Symmachiella dynata]
MMQFSRREMLSLSGFGLGQLAVADLLGGKQLLGAETSEPAGLPIHGNLHARKTHFPAGAKAVIQLIQNGGPSQMDLFDPKPLLTQMAGKPHPDGVEIHQPNNVNSLLPSPLKFQKYGECGMDVSEALPHVSSVVDDLCFVRSMHSEHNNHLEGLNMLLTCKIFPGRPVMGAWISYALGTENQNLPAYVVLRDPDGYTIGGKQLWANAFLPALYQGVEFSTRGAPIHHLNPPPSLPPGAQRANLDFLNQLNARHLRNRPGESELESRIENFELAARMQLEAPSVLDLAGETQETQKLYGLDNPTTAKYGTRCLMARRLVESGVRFVQVTTSPGQPWDHHNDIGKGMKNIATATDQGAAALIKDLKQRGLLESTIVMWAGEFGRLPTTQNGKGRDHNRNAFTLWFAGGGFQPGLIYGETDEFGYKSIVNRVSVPDMIATVCHQLGLDHQRVQFPLGGRVETPTNVTVSGAKVVGDLLSNKVYCS